MTQEKKYWFKLRSYGWGWTPITWHGWLTVGIYLVAIILASLYVPYDNPWLYTIIIFTLVGSLLGICMTKGPKPKWSWGQDSKAKPGEKK